ncbi:MAG: hypothetical protein Q9207_001987 [Kuettlingeria erythrocarpa]
MDATKSPGKVAVVEHDDKSRSSSLVVQHGSPSTTPIVFNGAAGFETVPKSGGLSFDAFTEQLGSHLAYRADETDRLMMFMELESLSGTSTSMVERHQFLKQSSIDPDETCGVIADVDRLFSDGSDERKRGIQEAVPYEKERLLSLEHHGPAEGTLYDVEKQTLTDELRRNGNRCSDAWFNTGRMVCLIILLAALVWHSVSLVS